MRAAVALVALAACGPADVHVTLAPVPTLGGCGRPANARSLIVRALGDFPTASQPVDVGGPVDIASFPPDTRQLAVEVLGPGGADVAIGATQPLQLGAEAEGATIPIMMAPKDGFCGVEPMHEPRDHPLLVRLGAGALVIGGDAGGGPSKTAEYYDPATGAFTPIMVPPALGAMGFDGASLTALPDGRVVVAGGPTDDFSVYDPQDGGGKFQRPGALGEVRAYHAAVALDATHLLLAGGCSVLDATGACAAGSARLTTKQIDVDTGDPTPSPMLAGLRLGGAARLEPTGADLTGPADVLVAGGADLSGAAITTIDRFDPADASTPASSAPGASGIAAPLRAGAVLVALAPRGAPASGAASVVAPGEPPVAVASAPSRAGAVLVALEDGTVAAIGGATGTAVDRYLPAVRAWRSFPAGAGSDAPDGIAGSAAVRLDDGTVLVVGGHDATGTAQAGAWIFRPAIGGPFAGSATATPILDDSIGQLDPLDPSLVTSAAGDWTLAPAASGGLASWAILAGPEVIDGTVTATMRPAGGAAILVGFVDPQHFDAVVVPAGGTARVERHAPGAIAPLCTGDPVPASVGGGASVTISVVRHADRVTATVTPPGGAATTVIDCAAGDAARGAVGIAPVGSDLIVDTIAVSR